MEVVPQRTVPLRTCAHMQVEALKDHKPESLEEGVAEEGGADGEEEDAEEEEVDGEEEEVEVEEEEGDEDGEEDEE